MRRTEYASRPLVAEAAGITRGGVTSLAGLPEPDAVVLGAGGRTTYLWTRSTVELWGQEQGRPVNWPDRKQADG